MYAAIMAGGEGTRLWPASRDTCPKQFINVLGGEPLVVQTLERLEGLLPPENVLVLINHKHQEAARRLLPDLPAENLIVEPRIRDTGPCIGLACEIIRKRAGEQTVVCLPSDHVIEPAEALRECLHRAEACVEAEPGALYAIGIRPTYPATGYGYLLRGETVGEVDGEPVFDVTSFHEKPAIALAEAYFDSGDYFWNSGICFGRTDTFREEMRRHQPELAEGLRQLAPDLDTERQAPALARVYPRFPRINVSDGVMEKADQVRVIEGHFAWDDVGTWRILQAHLPADEDGNVAQGEAAIVDAHGNLIYAGRDQLVAALGVRDLVIVATPDATLVTTRDKVQQVRKIVAQLKARHKDRFL
ncbi:MAG: sugar phosphate nucleotidyltransferase [Phycisphaerae bacterium]